MLHLNKKINNSEYQLERIEMYFKEILTEITD